MSGKSVVVEFEVRWGECDPAGIVYHPTYLDWFTTARMNLVRTYGLSYMESFHATGIVLVVLEAGCKFRKVLRAEDRVWVKAEFAELSRTRMTLRYEVTDAQGDCCGEGFTHHAFVDMKQRPVNVAKRNPDLWAKLEAFMQP